jgi:hypothetical protein
VQRKCPEGRACDSLHGEGTAFLEELGRASGPPGSAEQWDLGMTIRQRLIFGYAGITEVVLDTEASTDVLTDWPVAAGVFR